MKKALPQLARLRLAKDSGRAEVRLEIGVHVMPNGEPMVGIKMGTLQCIVTPERAEEIAVDLRSFALECRTGGPVG